MKKIEKVYYHAEMDLVCLYLGNKMIFLSCPEVGEVSVDIELRTDFKPEGLGWEFVCDL